jgi:hypothetical protein
MKAVLDYLLVMLLIFFLSLYIIDPFVLERSFKDLWANLAGGVLVALLIERIIKSSERKKAKRARKYVTQKLARICTSLIYDFAPAMQPLDYDCSEIMWKNALNAEFTSDNWKEYYDRVRKSRREAFKEVRYILDNQRDLLSAKLQNDVYCFKEALADREWKLWFKQNARDDVCRLYCISVLAATTSEKALRMLKDHSLLANQDAPLSEDIDRRAQEAEFGIERKQFKFDLETCERLLDESKSFRDTLRRKAMPNNNSH